MSNHYEREYQAMRSYNLTLQKRAMRALGPVLEREGTSHVAREQLEGIFGGYLGRIEVSDASLRALRRVLVFRWNAGISQMGHKDLNHILSQPGWKEVERMKLGERFRVTGYDVSLKGKEKWDFTVVPYLSLRVGLTEGEDDYTKWILERHS